MKRVLSQPAPEIDLVEFGESSINLMVRYWTKPQIVEIRQTKSRVILALKTACDQAQIGIPYLIRRLYVEPQQNGSSTQRSPS